LDAAVINTRLDFVSVFVRPDTQLITQKLSKSLSKVKNMRNVMTMLHKGVDGGNGRQGSFKSGVWSSLLEFCYHTIDVIEGLREVVGVESLPLCAQATEVLDRFQLQRVGKMVHDVVDLESSTEQHRTVVKRAVDENLDTIKDGYDGMEELLSQAALDITRTMP
ncbi:MAG: MutS protein msh5, partial [Watsoniomyces obsoletus]